MSALKVCVADGWFSGKAVAFLITVTTLRYRICIPLSANSHTLALAASKLDIYQMLCVQFELLMMGGKTA